MNGTIAVCLRSFRTSDAESVCSSPVIWAMHDETMEQLDLRNRIDHAKFLAHIFS